MQSFAGWVALSGAAAPLERLRPWQDWLAGRARQAEPQDIHHGWLLCWPAPAPRGERMGGGPERIGSRATDGIQPGHWWCEAGPAAGDGKAIARALLPAEGHAVETPLVPGGFAICHWLARERVLRLASDSLGCRPLYVARHQGQVLFSTDLPLLLSTPGLGLELNLRAVVDRLAIAGTGRPGDTLYQNIQQVPPGNLWQISPTGTTCQPLPAAQDHTTTQREREAGDAAGGLRDRIVAAVTDGLAGAHTPAVHLSGGLDSSAIACIAARALRAQGRTLVALCSVLPDDAPRTAGETDERAYMAQVLAQEPNIRPVWVTLPVDEHPFAALPAWFDSVGQAPWNTTTHALARLGEAGRAHGVDVVLSGFGGDLFASAPCDRPVTEMLRRRRWGTALQELRGAAQQHGWRAAIRAEMAPLLRHWRDLRVDHGRPAAITETGWNAFLADVTPHPRANAARHHLAGLSLQERMAHILTPGHVDLVVAGFCQFLSRRYGQTVCLPLMDPRVLQWVLQVDPREFTRDGLSRSLFRRAMAGILPEPVRLRSDKGPAFDPALMSHVFENQAPLLAWAADPSRPAWQVVDRQTFLDALGRVRPAARAQWRAEVFLQVIMAGAMGRFIDWHAGVAP